MGQEAFPWNFVRASADPRRLIPVVVNGPQVRQFPPSFRNHNAFSLVHVAFMIVERSGACYWMGQSDVIIASALSNVIVDMACLTAPNPLLRAVM